MCCCSFSRGGGGRGDSSIKKVGMLIKNFEIKLTPNEDQSGRGSSIS